MAMRGVLDILAGSGDITLQEAAEIRKLARSKNISIEEELLERGLDEQNILKESAKHYQFVPINLENGIISIGMVDPDNIEAKEALKFIATRLNQPFKIFLISRRDMAAVLGEYKGISGEVTKVLGELEVALSEESTLPKEMIREETSFVEDAPITKIVAVILRHATEGRAS